MNPAVSLGPCETLERMGLSIPGAMIFFALLLLRGCPPSTRETMGKTGAR